MTYPEGSALPTERGSAQKRSAALTESGAGAIRPALLTKSQEPADWLFPVALGWTHYLILMGVGDPGARAFCELEAARQSWSTRELDVDQRFAPLARMRSSSAQSCRSL